MARNRSSGSSPMQRQLLAEACARLIAEDGITDYALAKRKAARQLGCDDTRNLPGNEEIDEALRQYRSIYQSESHREIVRILREKACELLRRLQRFEPWLTGSVLSGTAGPQSTIELLILSDDPKGLEFFLLNEGREYRHADCGVPDGVCIEWEEEHIPVAVTILPARPGRLRGHQERMRLDGVEALLEER